MCTCLAHKVETTRFGVVLLILLFPARAGAHCRRYVLHGPNITTHMVPVVVRANSLFTDLSAGSGMRSFEALVLQHVLARARCLRR